MGRFVRTVMAMTLVTLATLPVTTFAQSPPAPGANYSPVPPKGHEAFFRDVAEIMKKHPESSKRFGLWDHDFQKTDLKARSQPCPEGQGCGFYCWTSPATHECCECNPRLK